MAKLPAEIEESIKKEALKYLANGRGDWDIRHTLTAVKWMKRLADGEGGNEKILIPTMYFHDTGYEKLPYDYSHPECLEAKASHAVQSAKIAEKYLRNLDYFSDAETNEIVRLVLNHDIHDNISDLDRQLVFEADGLGQIDWYHCKPSYDKHNTELFMNTTFSKERIPGFRTKTGKTYLETLLPLTKQYLKDWSK